MGNARCDVHGIHQAEALANAAFCEAFPDLRGDVQESPAGRDLEPEFFAEGFHGCHPIRKSARFQCTQIQSGCLRARGNLKIRKP